MSEAPPRPNVLLPAVILGLFLLAAFWIYSERQHAEHWRLEYKAAEARAAEERTRQQAQAQQLKGLARSADVENLKGEITHLRGELEQLRTAMQNVPRPQIDLEPVVAIHGRGWGPEQATGAPDTLVAGDHQTAWASLTPDGQIEGLELQYAEPVKIAKVSVYETYNPGALSRATVFDVDGKEIEIWSGKDPTPITDPKGISDLTPTKPVVSKKLKLYLNSHQVPGWNEIDAVGLVDEAGQVHWAETARASSSYADPEPEPVQREPGQKKPQVPIPVPEF